MFALWVPIRHKTVIATQNICVAKGQVAVFHAIQHDSKTVVQTFRNGDFSLQNSLRSGRPMEIDLAELRHVLKSGSDQITRNIAGKLGCIYMGINYQFKQLGLVRAQSMVTT